MPQHLRLIGARPSPRPPAATSLSRREQTQYGDFEARVELALAVMAAQAPHGADNLFDLVSGSMYTLALAITGSEVMAEDVAVDAFTEIWISCADRPEGAGSAWVMDVVCRCARARLAPGTSARERGRLRLVPTA